MSEPQANPQKIPAPAGYAPAPRSRKPPVVEVDFAKEAVTRLHSLWTAKRPGRNRLPEFSFFDALELQFWSDNLCLMGIEYDDEMQPVFRFDRVGRHLPAIDGGDFTGRYMHEALSPARVWTLVGLYEPAIRRRRAIDYHEVVPGPSDGPGAKWDMLVMPLANGGPTVDQLLVLTYVEPVEPAAG